MNVEEIMSRPPQAIRPEDSLLTAAHRMWMGDYGALPVVDGQDHVIGVITDRDICMGAHFRDQRLHDLRVADSMARKVLTCRATDSLDAALEMMSKYQVRRLPVVDAEGRLEGVISVTDIIRECATVKRGKTKVVKPESVLATFAHITSRRKPEEAASGETVVDLRPIASTPREKTATEPTAAKKKTTKKPATTRRR